MRGRERNNGATTSADLLVCFQTRRPLSLMPKPICSPSRPSEPNKQFLHHPHNLKKSSFSGRGHGKNSMLLPKNKRIESDISEPTSPKVTCAGQIKVRPKGGSCKNWQSVMEQMEKLHNKNKKVKKPNWIEALGFKKDVMQFLTCLKTLKFDFRCFGSFPSADITSSDDDDDDEEDENVVNQVEEDEDESSKAVFSKWFMVLQENQNSNEVFIPKYGDQDHKQSDNDTTDFAVPPSNALLLMRCRSAPAKSWLEEREEDEEEEEEDEEEVERKKKLEEIKMVVMKYDTDFHKLSSDIAKETWVVGGVDKDQMSRSRSCRR